MLRWNEILYIHMKYLLNDTSYLYLFHLPHIQVVKSLRTVSQMVDNFHIVIAQLKFIDT